jgi:cellulose synthase/poly-beta-1,6-N-acetylglucosamine synthase-like glycosyltransferase
MPEHDVGHLATSGDNNLQLCHELPNKMNKPLVSVVMVVCNVDRFLAESIESILRQTFNDFEFIIVDFGSTDKSKSIISSYAAKDSRVKFHEIPHCGLAEARNAGCFFAQGRYIAIMDADDVSVEDRLMREVEFMETHPEVGFLGGATQWIDATGRLLHVQYFPAEHDEIKSALVSGCPICQSTILIRREAFVLVGGYRVAFAPAEDYDLWLRIVELFQCANLKRVLLKYRVHPHQVSFRKRTQQVLCILAAQAAASSRRDGRLDPLTSVQEITPAVLAGLGVSEAMQQTTIASEYLRWIRIMYAGGEYSSALNAAVEMLQSSDWKYAERWVIADMRLLAARLYWKQKRFARSLLTAAHAFMTRPIMLGRPLKRLWCWIQSRAVPEEGIAIRVGDE